MSAPHDNQYALKYKTSEDRQKLCQKYCEHIEQGYSDESFPECDIDTLKKYILDFPEDFHVFGADVSRSRRIRQLYWEKVGILGATGQIKRFSAISWAFNMKNRFRWTDRQDVTSADDRLEVIITRQP